MDKRFLNFALVACTIFIGYTLLMGVLFPPEPPPPKDEAAEVADGVDPPADAHDDRQPDDKPADDDQSADDPAEVDPTQPGIEAAPLPEGRPRGLEIRDEQPRRVQLGSLAPDSPFRMLVTINRDGAAIERAELKSRQYRDIEDRSGYWGHLALSAAEGKGAVVGIVGPGTPAALAGLEAGDVVTQFDGVAVANPSELQAALRAKQPGDVVAVVVDRDGRRLPPLNVTLTRRPLEVMRPELRQEPFDSGDPENADPLSLLLTLQRVGDRKIADNETELPGVDLYRSPWWIVEDDNEGASVTLARELPDLGVQVIKRFTLAELPPEVDPTTAPVDSPAYHLTVEVELRNIAERPQALAYRFDGPTGLPMEGWWYSYRTSRNWMGGSGARDVVVQYSTRTPRQYSATTIAKSVRDSEPLTWGGQPLSWVAIDAQYFAAALIPQKQQADETWLSSMEAIVVGELPDARRFHTSNVTCRMISETKTIEAGEAITHNYVLFAGPKIPSLLTQYAPPAAPQENLSELVYYGWPIWALFARPMSQVLHFFYGFVGNYGLAIIMLTVLVRGCMFPISRKQALGAQKMQELQPEMKKIAEKYKKDYEKRGKAIQELQRKHNYNPLAGCLPMFIQLPIFIGLYRALMVDIELRDAPLISENFAWARNLGAPDMLWYWEPFLPAFLAGPTGWLGPYLNVLPLITIVLFIWQQKMFMPPPTDEQAALQQKVMRFMMVFMGLLFFKVASGLCLY
ncbi:MAG: YidC/Oxa1 family insertase periplasmic-domain containing protein, partial [Pirellulales bacterium]